MVYCLVEVNFLKKLKRLIAWLLCCGSVCMLTACAPQAQPKPTASPAPEENQGQTAPQILTASPAPTAQMETPEAKLLCLNIGKADCMLLLWQDQAYLIDGGYYQTWPALETALSQYQVTHLNGVFLTHCHKDHFGGLYALAASDVPVDAWYAPAL